MDPELTTFVTGLAEVTARNTASAVYDKINAVKTGKANQEMVNQLSEIIDDLIADKNELTRIARGLERQLVAEQISAEDINYITSSLVPTIEKIVEMQSDGEDPSRNIERVAMLEAIRALLSPETLTIMQLLGFSFRDGVGGPLTRLCQRLILSIGDDSESTSEIAVSQARSNLALLEISQDNASFKRYKEIISL